MNAYTFDTPSPTCPVCHRAHAIKPHRLLRGLLTCQYCRERLVVSRSGHYVRDPFTFKQLMAEQRLRQQSHPLARIWRDCQRPNSLLIAIISGVVLLGAAFTVTHTMSRGDLDQPPASTLRLER